MKRGILGFLIIIAMAATNGTALAKGNGGGNRNSGDYQYTVLSLAEAEALRFLREEEKLARDVYIMLGKQWGLDIFSNISESEQRHMDAVKDLLDKYRVEDPARPPVGQFTNADLQAAYDALMERGMASLIEALHVGAYIEELDIGDLQEAKETTNRDDILQVYDNLMQASRNHLRAFVSQIESRGVAYDAQILSQEEVDAIVNSPMERGH